MSIQKFIVVSLTIVLLVACTSFSGVVASLTPASTTPYIVTVFAAASLTEAFSTLGTRFEEQNLDAKVIVNFAGSQQLAQQLVQGAPADVFASADWAQMQAVIEDGRISASQVRIFAHNHLVVVIPEDNPAQLDDLADLAKPGLALAIAAEAVPVGHYTLEFLERASQDPAFEIDYKEKVLENIVSYEATVRAVLSKVLLGEVDAGFVYISDLVGSNSAHLGSLSIPQDLNTTAEYFIAPLEDSQHSKLAADFISFLLSQTGQQILVSFGLLPMSQTASSGLLP